MKCNMTFLSYDATDINTGIALCHWHWLWCHMIPLHWCQCLVMWTAPSMTPLHSFHQDDQNETQLQFFGHVTPLEWALALCDTDHVVNGIIAFLRSGQST